MKTMSLESRIEDRKEELAKRISDLELLLATAAPEEETVLIGWMESMLEELAELQMYTMGF